MIIRQKRLCVNNKETPLLRKMPTGSVFIGPLGTFGSPRADRYRFAAYVTCGAGLALHLGVPAGYRALLLRTAEAPRLFKSFKAPLTKHLIDGNRNGIREIQASQSMSHGQSYRSIETR